MWTTYKIVGRCAVGVQVHEEDFFVLSDLLEGINVDVLRRATVESGGRAKETSGCFVAEKT